MGNEVFHRLNNRKLAVKNKRRGMHKGTRQSKIAGSSFDFSDYRNYQIGDDIRQIDWNIYGRTDKLYIKQFLDEQEIFVSVYLDCTSSMQFDDKKWKLAKNLAASFCYIALQSDDRLAFVPVGDDHYTTIKRKGSLNSKHVFYHIQELPEFEQKCDFPGQMAKKLVKNSQLAIIITDGFEELEKFELLFRKMVPIYKQIRFMQILSEDELEPAFSNDLKLVDIESKSIVNVSMSNQVISMYKDRLKNHNERLSFLCNKFGISYLQVSNKEDFQTILFHTCVKNGWVD